MAQRGIKPGEFKQAVPVEIGLMTEEGYPHAGTLDYVAPMIDPSTGTLTARGILQNSARTLLPGMFLRIRVPLAVERANALLVPDEALGADQSGSYLLVVDKDGMVQQRTVKTGQLEGKLRVISSGIAADDLVVVSGNQKAIPGEKVAPEVRTITADTASAPPGKS
jgi:membrane fusion protein, multidrug efflux system